MVVDLGGRPDEDRLDDPEFRRLRSAERGFIARMHDDRLRRRDLLCPGDQTLVFRFRGMGLRTYCLKRAYFTFSFSGHAGCILFRSAAPDYDALDLVPLTSAEASDGLFTTVNRSSF